MGASFLYSLILHALIFVLVFVQLPTWMSPPREKAEPVPIMIDLKKVEIADKTNLPPQVKASPSQEQKAAPKVSPPKPKPVPPKAPQPKSGQPAPKAAAAVEKKTTKPAPKVKSKPVPSAFTKKAEKPASRPDRSEESLESLLASVEKMSKSLPETPSVSKGKEQAASDGIKGGTGGDLSQKLTISELDFISTAIRKNWNLDPGAEGIDKMIIEIRIALDKSGKVYSADILDQKRYQADKSFRSVAESARRAIYICDGQGADSPFRILAAKRPETYGQWKEMVLRFNPMDGGIF